MKTANITFIVFIGVIAFLLFLAGKRLFKLKKMEKEIENSLDK